jgi:hypothetical protein
MRCIINAFALPRIMDTFLDRAYATVERMRSLQEPYRSGLERELSSTLGTQVSVERLAGYSRMRAEEIFFTIGIEGAEYCRIFPFRKVASFTACPQDDLFEKVKSALSSRGYAVEHARNAAQYVVH